MIDIEPGAVGDEAGERLRKLDDQRLPRRGRKILAHQQRLADGREMAEALDDAVDRKRRHVGAVIFDQQQAGLRAADLGDRGGDGARQAGAARDRGLDDGAAGRRGIDKIGIDEQRLQRIDGAAICGWSAASAMTMAGGALGLAASASASARRTSGDGSSSSISMAPSAAPRSSAERSE